MRTTLWGFDPDESLSIEELLTVKYRGIRPAPGYPACPDHRDKKELWNIMDVETHTGISLTESCMMQPGASVSGYIFSHPESVYYSVGNLQKDQIADLAARRKEPVKETEKWLRSNLAYQE